MKRKVSILLGMVLLMVLTLGVGSAIAIQAMFSLTMTENSVYHNENGGYYELSFTVDNSGYTDIREFAIGNNSAGSAWVHVSASNNPSSLTNGFIATKDGNSHWKVWTNDGYRPLTWLDSAPGFGSFDKAFLYTSWGYSDTNYSGYLEEGFTNGYGGDTLGPQSPFAAYSIDEGTISGSTVPIPGALWLLGSGLFGLVAVRRRKG